MMIKFKSIFVCLNRAMNVIRPALGAKAENRNSKMLLDFFKGHFILIYLFIFSIIIE